MIFGACRMPGRSFMSKHRIASSQRWFAFFCSRGNGGTQQAGDLSMAAKLVREELGSGPQPVWLLLLACSTVSRL